MRILYDSRLPIYKEPFGVLREDAPCRLRVDVPRTVGARRAAVLLEHAGTGETLEFPLEHSGGLGDYQHFSGEIRLPRGLYFYYFRIFKEHDSFRLFRQGRGDTNMEAGDRWQVSAIPAEAATPDWAKGAVFYQIFPDRFYRAGTCDLTGKLEPYRVHDAWGEEPDWRPNAQGEITNSDFFGGNLRGIREKLPELRARGVDVLYLNPIVKAWSNHRYDTADYKQVDPMLGTEADFCALCGAAHALGMRIILDGVFSHTGDRSPFFRSAVSDPASPYRSWYQFHHWPDVYESWWGIHTLPCLDKSCPAVLDYLVTGEDSVVAHWLRLGADGWRLDVVDELPDEMVAAIRKRMHEVKPDSLLLGEVWEDASNKEAYGRRRRYFTDGELDGVMNYPLKQAMLNYCLDRDDGSGLGGTLETLLENYPEDVLACCMTLLSTHDTARALTVLGGGGDGSREEEAMRRLSPDQRRAARARLKMAAFLQFLLPGAPSVYYGDEAGMEGGKDPFNRRCYPWGREDADLMRHYRALGILRQREPDLRTGKTTVFAAGEGRFGFRRGELTACCNRGEHPWELGRGEVLLGRSVELAAGDVILAPGGYALLRPEPGERT